LYHAIALPQSSSDTSAEQTGYQSDVQNVRLDDFFNFNEREMEQSQKHLQFLNYKDRELSMLHRHPEVKILFLRYNTTLPSSAPVERLFSAGALVLTKRQNRLSDTLFESLVLLKLNKHLL